MHILPARVRTPCADFRRVCYGGSFIRLPQIPHPARFIQLQRNSPVSLRYGYVKSRLISDPFLKGTRRPRSQEIQYHLRFTLDVNGEAWDVAVNVGTSDADDLLKFKLVYDFRHPLIAMLGDAEPGAYELTGLAKLPALDFTRGADLLDNTGRWRDSDVMDGSDVVEPVASLKRLLVRAKQNSFDVYVFGRFYKDSSAGIHDTHMNQGSTGGFIHRAGDDHNDHNDIWQDGALFVNVGEPEWAAYFAAFNKQFVPTDDLGNPAPGAGPI
jgi:uncharacterized protein YukJ